MSSSSRSLKIGYLLLEKKQAKTNWAAFLKMGADRGHTVSPVSIDLDNDVAEQAQSTVGGDFDVVLAKFTDYLVLSEAGDVRAIAQIERWQGYEASLKEKGHAMAVIDSVDAQLQMLSRRALSVLLDQVIDEVAALAHPVQAPKYVVVDEGGGADEFEQKLRSAVGNSDVQFPVVAKPVQACGSVESHLMGIVFSLDALASGGFEAPLLVQEYFNHDAVVFKAFVLDDYFDVVARSSLRNFDLSASNETVKFDSQGINQNIDASQLGKHVHPPRELIAALVAAIHRHLGLSLFGFDVIQNVATKRWGVIDVNFFPGYSGVDDLHERLYDLVEKRACQ
jgi:inositol-1,3,4-trisphosphate 5/6-kinase / inositol-tetrakisphosphate 1-kinase